MKSNRPWNFSPGPSMLADEVLQQAASEMFDYKSNGMSVMEISHRSKTFIETYEQTIEDVRHVLDIPSNFEILFMQGGAQGQNAIVPMNLLGRNHYSGIDFAITGLWSQKSYQEAKKYSNDVRIVASNESEGFVDLPDLSQWQIRTEASYIHICSNETVHGIAFQDMPNLQEVSCDLPLVVDFSSDVASRPINWSRIALAFGGAQKNLGIAGVTLVVINKAMLKNALPCCPSVFNYTLQANSQSMLNTPPVWAIYIMGLVLQWIKRQTEEDQIGLKAIALRNQKKSQMLYDYIDNSGFYYNNVKNRARSVMNIPFFLQDEKLNDAFIKNAQTHGLLQLKGHKHLGGMRASLYNAMPITGVKTLIDFMMHFEKFRA